MVTNILVTQKHEFSVALSITPETYTESHGHVFDKETFMSISTSLTQGVSSGTQEVQPLNNKAPDKHTQGCP